LVSVIIRSMGRVTLKEALDSVAQQTYPHIEILVVNAKGEDHPTVPARSGHFPVLFIPSAIHLDRSRAANVGIDQGNGDYLAFLDDDDLLFPDHIACLVKALRDSTGARCAYAGVRVEFYRNGRIEREGAYNEPYDPVKLWTSNFIPIHAVLFHRSLCLEGCRFDENLDVYEDWDFWMQLSQHTTFVHLDRISACYRNFGFSGMGVTRNERFLRTATALIYDKWKQRWTGEQLFQMIRRANGVVERYKALQQKAQSFKAQLAASQAEAAELASRQESAHALTAELASREESAHARTAELASRLESAHARTAELASRLESAHAWTADLKGRLTQGQDEIRELAARVRVLEAHANDLMTQLADRDQTIHAIRQSTSWRVTAPLRGVSLAARWLARSGQRTLGLLYRLSRAGSSRTVAAVVPYYQRYVPLRLKLMIPDVLRNLAKRLLAADRPGPSSATSDRSDV